MSSVRAFAIVVAAIPALLLGGLSGYALRPPALVSTSCDVRHSQSVTSDICAAPARAYHPATQTAH